MGIFFVYSANKKTKWAAEEEQIKTPSISISTSQSKTSKITSILISQMENSPITTEAVVEKADILKLQLPIC